MAKFIQDAFNAVCAEAKTAEGWFVCLMEKTCRYAGPEEGGTWVHDSILLAYQHFNTEEQANAAREKVDELASELEEQDRAEHGQYCLNSMEWLEKRGLDAGYLPEPDGPSEYYVYVTQELPSDSYAPTHYE